MTEPEKNGAVVAAPPHIRDLADACRTYVQRSLGAPLDCTPETLPLLDHHLASLDATKPGPVHELVASAAGAYFGEIVRRIFPCRWFAPPGEPFRWRIEFESIFLHFNPVAVAFEAIARRESGLGAAFETLEADQDLLRAVLAGMPPVREDDFFRLAVRLEVLERVVEELVLLAKSRDDREEWSAAEYESLLDEPTRDTP